MKRECRNCGHIFQLREWQIKKCDYECPACKRYRQNEYNRNDPLFTEKHKRTYQDRKAWYQEYWKRTKYDEGEMIENLFFVDLETTGFSHKRHAIIQIGGILEVDDEEKDRFELEVAPFPTDEIDDEALAVNKYTREEIAGFVPPAVIHNQLMEHIGFYTAGDDFFTPVAFNAPFDVRMLKAWFGKCGNDYDSTFYPAIDVLEMARKAMPSLKNHKMITVAQALGIEFKEEDAHDAMNDVEAMREIYKKLRGEG